MTASPPPRRGRPPVSSRETLEGIAFELLLSNGYEETTVETITSAAHVSRTTFFRYFGSKAGVVWGEFDRAIQRLRAALAGASGATPLAAIRIAVTESTRQSQAAAPETWLDRFRVMDRDPAVASETASHWRDWSAAISRFVSARTGLDADAPLPAAIGGAVQATYVAVLRTWIASTADVDIDELSRALAPICAALEAPLADAQRARSTN